MTRRRHAVPWLSWTEWHDVRGKLFSSDPYAQQRGVSRVASWRSRAQLPVAINATAQLVELQLHESMAQHHHHAIGVSSRSYMELSLLYSNIIVRCVNGLVDGSQKGAYAVAVSTLAQRIGIPLWIVDLRHESTHNQLPSLSVLRFAARHLLAWLQANYWEAQVQRIQGQVMEVSHWLLEQLPHLKRQPADDEEQEGLIQDDGTQIQIDLKPSLDVDTLRNIVVPLLVDGEQLGASRASTGLLFLEAPLLLKDQGLRDIRVIVQKDAFITLLLQLQPLWRSFSASLLARLCHKVFDAICTQESRFVSGEGGDISFSSFFGDQEKRISKQNEAEMAVLWIKFMISSDYRERVRLQIGPIHDLCQCGAEMLALAENLQPGDVAEGRKELLERFLAALRFSKAVKNHSTLAIEAAIATSLASESAIGWTQLPVWVESPIGLRYCYTSYQSSNQSQVFEFPLDDDSLTPDSTTFVAPRDEEGINETDADDVMDALMEDLDATYDATLQQTLDLQATIARDGLRQGGSAMVLPKQELQRIREEIEIW